MKQIYKKPLWIGFFLSFLFAIGLGGMAVFLFFVEKGIDRYFFLGTTPLFILSGIAVFYSWRNFAITIDDKFITQAEKGKIGGWKMFKLEFIQLKLEDIIAIYMVETELPCSRAKSILIFPKADTGDKELDEKINFEVKNNKKSNGTKAYVDWLIVNKKGIKISKTIKNYQDLIKEVYKRAPQAVIDNEIRRLIEKNEKKNKKVI